jgi:glutamate formiminotransferase
MGVRDFLIAMNVDFAIEDLEIARLMARHIRELRREGDSRFLGVRALGFPLASRKHVQLSMNVTLPDLTPVDPILEWVIEQAAQARIRIAGTELIGVIRDIDVPTASRLPIRDQQIVETGP